MSNPINNNYEQIATSLNKLERPLLVLNIQKYQSNASESPFDIISLILHQNSKINRIFATTNKNVK